MSRTRDVRTSVDFDAIFTCLRDQFGPEVVLEHVQNDLSDPKKPIVYYPPQILIKADAIVEIATFLRDNHSLRMDSLMNLASVDRDDTLSVVYYLHSMSLLHKACLRVDVPVNEPVVPTVETVWITANWHEREAFDMMGLDFAGHSDLRTILLPDGWEGHPLRKNYQVQEFYRGMKVPY